MKGAFTDAKRNKPGRFALARSGTLFLDEISELTGALQVKLLRVLQQGEYEPLGSTEPVRSDVRIIAATNSDLKSLLGAGRIREDFYYRINVIKINLPPLLERRDDIPLLVDHFVRIFNLKMNKTLCGVDDEVMALLMAYDFPGNIRELENIIEHAFVLCRETRISVKHLPQDLTVRQEHVPEEQGPSIRSLVDAERSLIMDALKQHGGSRSRAARQLGMHPSTLWRKMKKLNMMPS
jgi:transcriptional regulator with PAS, ATPase and Fis domain